MNNATSIDLTRGVYRRVYAGFVNGRRICSVSIGAEAWFWRLMALADDFGNLNADPETLHRRAGGRRDVPITKSEAWITELEGANLLRLYQVNGDRYCNILHFMELQPAGRSGRRVQRCPDRDIQGNPGESRGIPGRRAPPVPEPEAFPEAFPKPDRRVIGPSAQEAKKPPEPESARAGSGLAGLAGGGGLGPELTPPVEARSARQCLESHGVGEPALSALAEVAALTGDEVEREFAELRTRNGVRSAVGVVIDRLAKRHGVRVPKAKSIGPEVADAARRIEALRAARAGGAR